MQVPTRLETTGQHSAIFALKPADAVDEPPELGDSAIIGEVFSVTSQTAGGGAAYTYDHESYTAQTCLTTPVENVASESSSSCSASTLTSSSTTERSTEASSSTTKTTEKSTAETAVTSTSSASATSPTSQTIHNGLSKTAKVGIGVGTSLGSLILLLLFVTALMLWRKRRSDREGQRKAAATRDAWQDKPELPAQSEKEEQSLSSTSVVPAEGTYRAQDVELESPDVIAVKSHHIDSRPIHELQ